jgi:hypothetical protein
LQSDHPPAARRAFAGEADGGSATRALALLETGARGVPADQRRRRRTDRRRNPHHLVGDAVRLVFERIVDLSDGKLRLN